LTRIVYVLRSFPRLTETFVAREVAELVRRGEPLEIWSLRPPDAAEPQLAAAAPALPVRRLAPHGPLGALTLAAAAVRRLVTRPRRAGPALAWALRWSWRERDPRHLLAFPYAAWLAPRLGPDAHVHAHFANTPATVALLAAWLSGARWSFTGHARDLWAVTSPAFLSDKARRARFVAVGTEYGARLVREAVGDERPARVLVVRTGLEPRPSPPCRPEPGLVVATGRLVAKKGLDDLLRAIALLRAEGVEARCEIIGGGPEEPALRRLVEHHGLGAAVRLRGPQPLEEVQRALTRASVFALPCRDGDRGDTDNLPLAIIEALQAGVPVVATPVAGIPEAVVDGHSGLLVPPRDPSALAEAVGRVLRDTRLQERLAAGGREVVARDYDLWRNVGILAGCFAEPASAAPMSAPR
jgi:glycosyltransferase involved in cell wall biosynthesis